MKLFGDGVAAVKKVAAAVVAGVTPAKRRRGDPFYSDDERIADINARSWRGGAGRWLGPRRRGWLR